MPIYRKKNVRSYTKMSNCAIDDRELSLKAIGLLTKMLRLPDNWVFSINGLVSICKDGRDSVSSALNELEKKHYIKRERIRNSDGTVGGITYSIYEEPYDANFETREDHDDIKQANSSQKNVSGPFFAEKQTPLQVKPNTDCPQQEKDKETITNQPKTELPNTYEAINPLSITSTVRLDDEEDNAQIEKEDFLKPSDSLKTKNDLQPDRSKNRISQKNIVSESSRKDYESMLKKQICYADIVARNSELDDLLDQDSFDIDVFERDYVNLSVADMIIETIADLSLMDGSTNICGIPVSNNRIVDKFNRLNRYSFTKVIKEVVSHRPKNKRGYALSVIYNY